MAIHFHDETASAATRKKEARSSQKQAATPSSWRTQELALHTLALNRPKQEREIQVDTCDHLKEMSHSESPFIAEWLANNRIIKSLRKDKRSRSKKWETINRIYDYSFDFITADEVWHSSNNRLPRLQTYADPMHEHLEEADEWFTNRQEFDDVGKLIDEEFDSVTELLSELTLMTELLSELTLMMGRNLYFWDAESLAHAKSERRKSEETNLLGGMHLLEKGVSIEDFTEAIHPVTGIIMYWVKSDGTWKTECVDV